VEVDFVCGAAQAIDIAMVNHSANAAVAVIRSVRIRSFPSDLCTDLDKKEILILDIYWQRYSLAVVIQDPEVPDSGR
jgi:hypothetical protein